MPREDGTGPRGEGAGTGRGRGKAWSGGFRAGPGGYCICPSCGERVTHRLGKACFDMKCPNCESKMARE